MFGDAVRYNRPIQKGNYQFIQKDQKMIMLSAILRLFTKNRNSFRITS